MTMTRGTLLAGIAMLSVGWWTPWSRGQEPAVAPAVLAAEQQRIEAVARASRSAVAIFSRDGSNGGSGVVISPDGYALTNFHVAAPVGEYLQCGMADGQLYDAVLVGLDPTGDVALIKLVGRDDFPAAAMADSDQVRVGDWCFAIGNPFLLATNFQPTISYGIVSGVHRYQPPAGTLLEYTDCLQTDAAINPGNSGGPLFNARGELIGVNGRGSFEKRGRVNVGLGYAISINQIKHFLSCLRSGRIVDHATLGATVGNDANGKVLVTNILSSSDAFRRGLRYGDELIAFGGRSIDSANAFKNVLGIFPRDWQVPLSYRRDGQRFEIQVRLAGVHAREELLAKVQQQVEEPPPAPDGQPPKRPPDAPKSPDGKKSPDSPDQPDTPPADAESGSAARPATEIPAAIAKQFEARSGFANYYFNKLERQRTWEAFVKLADARATREWRISGRIDGRIDATIRLDADRSSAELGASRYELGSDRDLSEQLDPPGSGGLLAALHLWRRLVVLGPERFGEVVYLGQAPRAGHDGLLDVLAATFDVVEARFYFAPATGRLAAVEFYPEDNVDPCELEFDDYRPVQGRELPHRILVHWGDETRHEWVIQSWTIAAAPGPNES